MNSQRIFPVLAMTESGSEPAIKLEGQKVVFDKKVSLLPADTRRVEEVKVKPIHGSRD